MAPPYMHSIIDKVGTYIGGIKNGKKHGLGKMTYANGGIYIGNWKDNRKHGQGKETQNGDVYEGVWKRRKPHGQGKFTWVMVMCMKEGLKTARCTIRKTDFAAGSV